MYVNRPQTRPIAIILAIILIIGAAIYAALMTIARVGDNHQREIEQRILKSALTQQRMKLDAITVQEAYWDSAYDAVGERLNLKWLDANVGISPAGGAIPLTAIFDAGSRIVYRSAAAAARADAALLQTSPSLAALAQKALASPPLPPRPVTAFVRVGRTIYLAAAQRIVPNDGRETHPLSRHYVLSYLQPVDAASLRGFQSGFDLAQLALSSSPGPGMAHVALADSNGTPLAYLSWRSARPGKDFANAAAPLAIGCFLLVAGLQLAVLRWWMQATRRMHDEGVARTAFLADASHELRTPLNAIIGFSDCMADEVFGPLSPRYREYARDIKASGQLLLEIVNDVLDLTHLSSAHEIPMQPIKMADAVAGALRMLREYGKGDDISINYFDHAGGAEVAASEKALCQILLNLGSNAVKFSAPRSSIDIVLQRGDGFVELRVRDRGIGIPAEKLPLVGQPFYQAHPSSARKPGSGLGVAIVKKLTERLGGEFAISSVFGMGTTVTVRLPELPGSPEATRARAA